MLFITRTTFETSYLNQNIEETEKDIQIPITISISAFKIDNILQDVPI